MCHYEGTIAGPDSTVNNFLISHCLQVVSTFCGFVNDKAYPIVSCSAGISVRIVALLQCMTKWKTWRTILDEAYNVMDNMKDAFAGR